MKNWDEKNGTAVKQMKSIWNIPFTTPSEKKHGKHPTQKPIEILRIMNWGEDILVSISMNGF